jgi:hypothetical protein
MNARGRLYNKLAYSADSDTSAKVSTIPPSFKQPLVSKRLHSELKMLIGLLGGN